MLLIRIIKKNLLPFINTMEDVHYVKEDVLHI